MKTFTAYVEYDPATKLFVGVVPGLPGAHTQGASLDELQKNLREVVELCLAELRFVSELRSSELSETVLADGLAVHRSILSLPASSDGLA